MTVVPRAVLLVALVATIGLTTVLGITDPSAPTVYPTRFLIWNLALAWVPLVMAVGFAALSRSVWQLPWLLGWLVVVVSIGLCAVGVVIGRFQRWNSWDLVTQPKAVVASTLEWVRSPFENHQSTGVALAVAAFFGLAYLTIWSLGGLAIAPSQLIRN